MFSSFVYLLPICFRYLVFQSLNCIWMQRSSVGSSTVTSACKATSLPIQIKEISIRWTCREILKVITTPEWPDYYSFINFPRIQPSFYCLSIFNTWVSILIMKETWRNHSSSVHLSCHYLQSMKIGSNLALSAPKT